jgi:hypothetical protein
MEENEIYEIFSWTLPKFEILWWYPALLCDCAEFINTYTMCLLCMMSDKSEGDKILDIMQNVVYN